MSNLHIDIPETLQDIWDIKQKIYEETKNLSFEEYIAYVETSTCDIKSKLKKTTVRYGIKH